MPLRDLGSALKPSGQDPATGGGEGADYKENVAHLTKAPGQDKGPFDKNEKFWLVFRFRILIGLSPVDLTFLQLKI